MSNAPPQLHFDDGSRIMMENQSSIDPSSTSSASNKKSVKDLVLEINPRGSTPLEVYYEIDRISNEIISNIIPSITQDSDFLVKVALQFPDELLSDSAQVAWMLDEAISNQVQSKDEQRIPLVFVLGDTTYASCCPDEIGALHLNADVIVHFGQHACLSVSDSLPVIYSFGVQEWPGVDIAKEKILHEIENHKDAMDGIILVCERRYQNNISSLAQSLEQNDGANVIVGSVPKSEGCDENKRRMIQATSCCGSTCDDNAKNTCCNDNEHQEESVACYNDQNKDACCKENQNHDASITNEAEAKEQDPNTHSFGGLQVVLPSTHNDLTKYILIFIGDDSGNSKSRQFQSTLLKSSSIESQTLACWSYNPDTEQLTTDPMSIVGISRYLNRRFYLTQKAKMANIIGILVGTLSQDRFRSVVSSVRQKIEESGRISYTFVVGKINVAKLANFAEVECFVLVACGETSVLKDERDYHLPIITPTELEIALGEKDWDGAGSCNTDFDDFLQGYVEEKQDKNEQGENDGSQDMIDEENQDKHNGNEEEESDNDSSDDNDEPYFSVISGTYVSKPKTKSQQKGSSTSNDYSSMPGQGQVTEYKSEAAEFWKQREYKGLEANIGKDEAKAAIEGQTGIASDYGK